MQIAMEEYDSGTMAPSQSTESMLLRHFYVVGALDVVAVDLIEGLSVEYLHSIRSIDTQIRIHISVILVVSLSLCTLQRLRSFRGG